MDSVRRFMRVVCALVDGHETWVRSRKRVAQALLGLGRGRSGKRQRGGSGGGGGGAGETAAVGASVHKHMVCLRVACVVLAPPWPSTVATVPANRKTARKLEAAERRRHEHTGQPIAAPYGRPAPAIKSGGAVGKIGRGRAQKGCLVQMYD